MAKKKIITSFQNLPATVLEALNFKYPDGFENHVMKVEKGPNNFFYAVTVDYEETSYLVKVDVSVDSAIDDFNEDEVDSDAEEKESEFTSLEDEPSTEDEDVIG